MKKIFFFSLLLISLASKAQEYRMNLSLYQDMRLLFIGDNRGNGMFTPNITLRFDTEIFNFKKSNVNLAFGLEYADLSSTSFNRFSLGVGFITEFSFLEKIRFGLYINHGIIFRRQGSYTGMSANFEATYPIFKKLRILLLYQVLDRIDLSTIYNTKNNIKGSVFLGVKFAI